MDVFANYVWPIMLYGCFFVSLPTEITHTIHHIQYMDKQKQVQIQFKLVDVRQVQFATLCNEWPKGEMQVGNQINFNADTEKRLVRCLANVEFKMNDITQLLLSVETVFEFERESWSALYDLSSDSWIIPAGLLHHITDLTLSAARGILSVRTEDAGFPRVMLPLVDPRQFMRNNLSLKRTGTTPIATTPHGEA